MDDMQTDSRRSGKLLFDLGGILVRIKPISILWPGVAQTQSSASFDRIWMESETVRAYETGQIYGLESFYRSARKEMGITILRKDFPDVFLSLIGELFEGTLEVLQALKTRHSLFLLSNIGADHWLNCRDNLGLGQCFDDFFLSYQMGMMKPDRRIYQQILSRIDDDPKNIWYFDDREENVMIAREFGVNAIISQGGSRLYKDLTDLGFNIEQQERKDELLRK